VRIYIYMGSFGRVYLTSHSREVSIARTVEKYLARTVDSISAEIWQYSGQSDFMISKANRKKSMK